MFGCAPTRPMKRFAIDADRLQRQIEDLAAISEAPPPVVTRVLFSEADLQGRAFVKNLCQQISLSLREDAVGNLFARWVGKDTALAPLATGSHIDAIPNAGRYDGVVGVLGALEAVRALKASGFEPRRSIEIIVFTAEEPTRFGIGCLGSRLMSGALSLEKAAALRDRDGHGLDYWRKQAGLDKGSLSSVKLAPNAYAGFVELHIEQGPLLEREDVSIGVVEKIAAPSTLRAQLTGVGGHAGAVLMPERHDALLAGAEIALAVEEAALGSGSPDTVATTGVFRIEPGAVNSVPCRAWLEIDLRDTQLSTRDAALQRIEAAVPDICNRRGVEFLAFQIFGRERPDHARGLRGVSRVHLFFGTCVYFAGPLWLLFLLLSNWMLWFKTRTGLSDITVHSFTQILSLSATQHAFLLFGICMTVIFLPKLLALIPPQIQTQQTNRDLTLTNYATTSGINDQTQAALQNSTALVRMRSRFLRRSASSSSP